MKKKIIGVKQNKTLETNELVIFKTKNYKVYKKDSDTETNSHIRRLTDEERVEEIAHMLSGATLTEAALSNAKALLARN